MACRNIRFAANSVESSHDANSQGSLRRDSRWRRSSAYHSIMATTKNRYSRHSCALNARPGSTTPPPSTASVSRLWSSGKSRPEDLQVSAIRVRLLSGPMDPRYSIKRYNHVISAQRHLASGEPGDSWRSSLARNETLDSSGFATKSACNSSKFSRVHRDRSVNSDRWPNRHRCFQCSAAGRICLCSFSRATMVSDGRLRGRASMLRGKMGA